VIYVIQSGQPAYIMSVHNEIGTCCANHYSGLMF